MCAEMIPGTECPGIRPAWYAVQTAEFMERTAALGLRDREFLVYVPTIPEALRGNIDWMAPMITEYVFVFVWEINKNWRKLLSCAGALKILGPFSDSEIAALRQTEKELCKPKRLRKGWRRERLTA